MTDNLKSPLPEGPHPPQEVERLKHQEWRLLHGSACEIGATNSNISDYMRHWEGRALSAESQVAEGLDRLRALGGTLRKPVFPETDQMIGTQEVYWFIKGRKSAADELDAALAQMGEIAKPLPTNHFKNQVEMSDGLMYPREAPADAPATEPVYYCKSHGHRNCDRCRGKGSPFDPDAHARAVGGHLRQTVRRA